MTAQTAQPTISAVSNQTIASNVKRLSIVASAIIALAAAIYGCLVHWNQIDTAANTSKNATSQVQP